MTPDSWQRLKALFEQALERVPAQQTAFLAEACGEDTALKHEVESLLASHREAGGFLSEPAALPVEEPAPEGGRIGTYRSGGARVRGAGRRSSTRRRCRWRS